MLEVADLLVASAAKAEPPPDAGRRRRVSGAPETAPSAPALPSRWEYLVETLPRADASDRLASLGKKGWELVAAAPEADGILCVLKRPRPLDY